MSLVSVGRSFLWLQLGSTLPLVGVIWIVQILVYPQLRNVGAAEFVGYHEVHTRLISWVVGPLMLVEVVASVACVFTAPDPLPRWAAVIGFALTALAWGTTALASVPQHEVLARGFDAAAFATLVRTNWLRTFAWTARGVLLLWASHSR